MGTEPNISLLLTELQRNCQSLDTAEIATMKLNLEAWNVERYRETVKLDFQFSFFLGDKILVNLFVVLVLLHARVVIMEPPFAGLLPALKRSRTK